MRKRRLIGRLYPSYLLVTLAALLAIGGFASYSINGFYHQSLGDDLLVRARLLGPLVLQGLARDPAGMQEEARSWAELAGAHVTVLYPDGRVMADSNRRPEPGANQIDRPEIRAAKRSGEGRAIGYSAPLRERVMSVALPVYSDGGMAAIIRLGVPLTFIQRSLWFFNARLLLGGAVIAVLAALVSWFMAQRIARPLAVMRRGADRFAQGDFAERLAVPDLEEFASLAEAMNRMAAQLDERIRTVISQRNLQEAVLASMVEGVLAVDVEDTIVALNQAAGRLLGVDVEETVGHGLADVVRNAAFQGFVGHVRRASGPVEEEVVLHERGGQVLHMHGSVLRDARGHAMGAAIVLHDLTQLRRLEQVRQDFVANVSHELRTPITSIKGFVETIQQHAQNDPEELDRFLKIIGKQADRLAAILEDLLALSRMEQEGGRMELVLESVALKTCLQSAVQICSHKAVEKGVSVVVQCEDGLTARVNGPLFEQALANLLDNAVKYSESGKTVFIAAERTNGDLTVSVRDEGCGIAPEHLPRLFERFYRVDKARSRAMGGTGLGLAIVKHIVHVHRGRVEVESAPGKGSTFRIVLPAR